jgi:hypothetical protein
MGQNSERSSGFKVHLRAAIEVGFIVFLFYSNLLMGEFTRSNGVGKTLGRALWDIFTRTNFAIAIVTAVVAHGVFETFRRRL